MTVIWAYDNSLLEVPHPMPQTHFLSDYRVAVLEPIEKYFPIISGRTWKVYFASKAFLNHYLYDRLAQKDFHIKMTKNRMESMIKGTQRCVPVGSVCICTQTIGFKTSRVYDLQMQPKHVYFVSIYCPLYTTLLKEAKAHA